MSSDDQLWQDRELAQARETIGRQSAEIEYLKSRLASETYAGELRDALALASTAGTIAAPVTHSRLLEMIVEAAAHVISAKAASLFLINEETNELIFEVALGQKAAEVKKFSVPLGHGFAGLVAVSGQPMAVSDVQHDPRHASDIARSVGYVPQSILCVPLFYNDQIIGVLELLDKTTAPSFSAADMETLGLFANQAAVAIEQSRTHRNIAALIASVLESLGAGDAGAPGSREDRLRSGARSFARGVEEDPAYKQGLELAGLVREIVAQGERESQACRAILMGFAEYLRTRPTLYEMGGPG
jgi:GAF domain-containing protein